MEVISNYVLEDFSLRHKEVYDDYVSSFHTPDDHLLYDPHYISFEEIIEYYNKYRSNNLDKDCEALNKLLNIYPDHRQPHLQPLRQMYLLMDKQRNKAIGMTQIYCERNCTEIYVPQVIIEIAPNERKKGHGRRLIKLLLEDDRIGAKWLYFFIIYWNHDSMKLVESFNPETFCDVYEEYKIYKLHKKTE
jgi:predicted acetyltransferase